MLRFDDNKWLGLVCWFLVFKIFVCVFMSIWVNVVNFQKVIQFVNKVVINIDEDIDGFSL